MKESENAAGPRWPIWLAAAALAFFLLRALSLEWSINAQYSYGWVVPALCAYLVWERWKDSKLGSSRREEAQIFFHTPQKALFTFLLLLLALVIVAWEANPDWRLLNWLGGLTVVGLFWLGLYSAGGPAWWKHFAFATAFILTAIAWPTEIENLLVQSLMRAVAGVTVEVLNLLGIAAQQEGNLIRLAGGTLGIDEACSGVRSFQATIMAALFLGELARLNWRRRMVLVGAGVVLALGLNMVRAIWLSILAGRSGISAVEKWHDPAGYVLLAATFFGLLGISRALSTRNVSMTPVAPSPLAARRDVAPYLVVVVWLIACDFGTQAWYGARERGATRAARWKVDWPIGEVNFLRSPISETVRLILRFNEGESAVWNRSDGSRWHLFFFEWKPGRAAAALARSHRPEVCLPSTGFVFTKDRGMKIIQAKGLDLPVERLEFKRAADTILVYYILWEDRVQKNPSDAGALTRQNRLQAVLEGRRHLGQRVLEVVIVGAATPEKADADVAAALNEWIIPR